MHPPIDAGSIDCTDALAQAAQRPSFHRVVLAANQPISGCALLRVTTASKDAGSPTASGIGFWSSAAAGGNLAAGGFGRFVPKDRLKASAPRRCRTAPRQHCTSSSAWRTVRRAAAESLSRLFKPYMQFESGRWKDLPQLGSSRELLGSAARSRSSIGAPTCFGRERARDRASCLARVARVAVTGGTSSRSPCSPRAAVARRGRRAVDESPPPILQWFESSLSHHRGRASGPVPGGVRVCLAAAAVPRRSGRLQRRLRRVRPVRSWTAWASDAVRHRGRPEGACPYAAPGRPEPARRFRH